MFTTEMSVIIPLIIVLILGALIMFFLATELSLFEMTSSRDFMLRIVPYGEVNAYVVRPNVHLQIHDVGLWQMIVYSPRVTRTNPYASIAGKEQLELKTKYTKLWVNKQAAAFIKSGYERFWE